MKRSNPTPKRKKAAANPRKKTFSEATANLKPANETSARHNLIKKKSTFQ